MDKSQRRIGFALFIIILGAVLLVDNLGIFMIRFPWYLTEWYTILLLVGLFLLVVRDKTGPGLTLIAIAVGFFFADILDVSIFSLWPVALIIVGVLILIRKNQPSAPPEFTGTMGEDYLDEFAAFSGPSRKVTSKKFTGGRISTIFGGMEIDLSDAKLSEGRNVLDVFTIFGGSSIYVPPDWDVVVNVNAIFGGYEDDRRSVDADPKGGKLVITGTVLFGGGELKTKYPNT